MLTTQQVFNKVVNGGFYTQEDGLKGWAQRAIRMME